MFVLIIGAGAAGLTAAGALLDAGAEVLVLEASAQPGGRIRSLRGFADFPIELGAEEIHGTSNLIHDLALQTGAKIIRHDTRDDRLQLDGRVLPLSVAAADPDVHRAIETLQSIGHYAGENLTAEQWLQATDFPTRTCHYLASRLGVENGTTLDRLALRGLAGSEMGWADREWNFTLQGSYLDLFAPLLQRLGDRLHVASPVQGIEWSQRAAVVLADGCRRTADAVLVTVSLAVLQAGALQFSPPLPGEKSAALQCLGMDPGMKILLHFRERCWDETMYFLHAAGFFPQFWTPGWGKSSAPVLTAYLSGARAEHLVKNGIDPIAAALRDLDEIFGHRRASKSFLRGQVADWSADRWVRGLYSYPTTATTASTRQDLARSLDRKIYFAGEALALDGTSGTVHGAMHSGLCAAREIVKHGESV